MFYYYYCYYSWSSHDPPTDRGHSLRSGSGIYSVNVDYSQHKVTVWGICNKYDVLETVRSKRKEARFWNPEDNVMPAQEEEEEEEEPEQPPQDVPKPNPKTSNLVLLSKAGRSLSWKAWKKLVFTRSNSFWEMHALTADRWGSDLKF